MFYVELFLKCMFFVEVKNVKIEYNKVNIDV